MYGQLKQAGASVVRQSRFYLVPAAVIAGWLIVVAGVAAQLSQPVPLQASIERVLTPRHPVEPATLIATAPSDSHR